MKKLYYALIIFWIINLYKAQTTNPFPIQCIGNYKNTTNEKVSNEYITKNFENNCGNTSPYYSDRNLYLPQSNDNTIYIRLNFIFLTKPDGTGNFQKNNIEHVQFIDDVVTAMNYRLANLGSPIRGCDGFQNNNLKNTKLQVIINKIWRIDPAWDFLHTGYNPDDGPLGGKAPLYPPSKDYYYAYLDNDTSIPLGINVVFSNNGYIYNEFVNKKNYVIGPGEGWAAAQSPYYAPIDGKLRQFYPNLFNKYLWMKNYVADNPKGPYPNTPWSTVRSWYVSMGYGGFNHELGHNLGLDHDDCSSNIMSYDNTPPATHDYFSNNNIKTMYRMASISSARQYFTEDSFKSTNIDINQDQLWDLNFRLYSNVKISNNSSLKATCKIIMAPNSRFIIKDGSKLIIEGATIESANNSTWKGIKIEGKGCLLINPNTLINNNYFYAYADNTPLIERYKSNEVEESSNFVKNIVADKDYKIYPNPTGDFINIETKNKISKIEIYNLLNKSFPVSYKDNKVDVSNLSSDNYILIIHANSDKKTVHFIKK